LRFTCLVSVVNQLPLGYAKRVILCMQNANALVSTKSRYLSFNAVFNKRITGLFVYF